MFQGDATYTVAQVVVNDLLILVFYIPTIQLLLGISGISIPWLTLALAIIIFLVVPLLFGGLLRFAIVKRYGVETIDKKIIPFLKPFTVCIINPKSTS